MKSFLMAPRVVCVRAKLPVASFRKVRFSRHSVAAQVETESRL